MRIDSARLKDGNTLEFGDFNVFIGGNAVGKTTLVLELFSRAAEYSRSRWLWTDTNPLTFSSQDPFGDLGLLLGSMAKQFDGPNLFYFSQAAKDLKGDADLDGRYRFSASEYSDIEKRIIEKAAAPGDLLFSQFKFRRPFIAFANCEARLSLLSRVNVMTLSQPAQDAVNVLYRKGVTRREIDDKIHEQFRYYLSLLDHSLTQLELGFSKEKAPQFDNSNLDKQGEYEKIERWKKDNFIPIEEIGHGVRSMVKLLMNLLEPVNQVVFIDEPEMHIYPAQKRWLGRQLVGLAQERRKQVFLVTHDPIILQGILDSPAATRVFRINVDANEGRTIQRCDFEHVTDVGAKRNQDSYLQGLFYQRCIAVEGASDRAFYQVMTEELFGTRIQDKDLGFVACGGKGASKNVAYIAARVGLKSAFIFDFDALLWDTNLTRKIYETRGGTGVAIKKLEEFYENSFHSDQKRIKEAVGDAPKAGFDSKFVKHNKDLFKAAASELREVGIFLVPHGCLENWAPGVEPKYRFAELAPDVIKSDAKLRRDLQAFLAEVLGFIGA